MQDNEISDIIRQQVKLCIDEYIGESSTNETISLLKNDIVTSLDIISPIGYMDVEVRIIDPVNGKIVVNIECDRRNRNRVRFEPPEDVCDFIFTIL